MNIKRAMTSAFLALALSACTATKEAEEPNAAAAKEAALPDKLPIYMGTSGPNLFKVPEPYQLAIGALMRSGDNFCTGTLIADDVVLSAGHCAVDLNTGLERPISGVTFGFGKDMLNPLHKIAVKKIIPHPDFFPNAINDDDTFAKNDVALFILQEKASAHLPDVLPIPLNKSSLADLKGKPVQNVGYGATEENYYNTRRFWTIEEVVDVTSYDFTVNGKGKSSVCMGDSGGPSLYAIDDQIYVIGTVSWGSASCVDNDHFARTNDNIPWITKTLAEIGHAPLEDHLLPLEPVEEPKPADPNPVDNCQGITLTGLCEGNVAKWCENGSIRERDCTITNQVCGFSATNGYYCMDPDQPEDPCLGISYLGMCLGGVATWCENGKVKKLDCNLQGKECAYVDISFGYYCTDKVADDPCGGVPAEGACLGDVAVWCSSALKEVVKIDCAAMGRTCGAYETEFNTINYNCLSE